ncbi:MAG: trypsin-like peptidase domain-containing protein [Actinomycetota bacterium]
MTTTAPSRRWGFIAALVVLGVAVGALIGGAVALAALAGDDDDAAAAPATADAPGVATEAELIDVVQRFGPSVAALAVAVEGDAVGPFGALEPEQLPPELRDVIPPMETEIRRSSGSGFVIDVDGTPFLVSNFHVVSATLEPGGVEFRPGATIDAQFPDHPDPVPLEVRGVNPSFDLALLTPLDPDRPFPDVEPIPLADSDQVVRGQTAIAIGNPFGFDATVTSGIISSVGRFVPSVGQVSVPMLQTDAAINPGNSGGALLDSSGRLIGVNTAIFNPEGRSFAGIGLAVPTNLLLEALANLELGGVSNINDTRPGFGAQLGSLGVLPPTVRAELGLPDEGVMVLEVAPGGAAEQAGLQGSDEVAEVAGLTLPVGGDVIVAIDDRSVAAAEDLNIAITYESEIGQEVVLRVLRDGSEIEVPVRLGP